MKLFTPFHASVTLLAVVLLVTKSCEPLGSSERAQEIINESIQENGAHLFATKRVSFDFRERRYAAMRKDGNFIYTRSFEDSTGWVVDQLVNSIDFSRQIEGQPIQLTEEWQQRYGRSINSVLYFVEILYRLNDPAVNKTYLGKKTIKGEPYYVVKVTFDQEDGGRDFEDQFLYWIHEGDFTLDYLAYNYETDGGGVRFREAFDREVIGGITFQNYINYKPDSKTTPLEELPGLYDQGKLEELSRIVNTNIKVE